MDQFFPGFEDRRAGPHIEQMQDFVIQTFLVVKQRHFIDTLHVDGRNHSIRFDIAEMSDLAFDVRSERVCRAAQQDIRLNTDATKFFDTVLGGFGLEFTRGFHIGHESEVNVSHMLSADIAPELPDGLQEGQALDIANRPADFHDDDIYIRWPPREHRL